MQSREYYLQAAAATERKLATLRRFKKMGELAPLSPGEVEHLIDVKTSELNKYRTRINQIDRALTPARK
jgi:hypothetical protein